MVVPVNVNHETLVESRFKPIDNILSHVKDTLKVENIVKRVYNFKAKKRLLTCLS